MFFYGGKYIEWSNLSHTERVVFIILLASMLIVSIISFLCDKYKKDKGDKK